MTIDTIVKHLQAAARLDTATERLGELVVAKGLLGKEIASTQKIAEESIPGQLEIPEDQTPATPGLTVVTDGDGLVQTVAVDERDRCMTINAGQRCYLRTGHGVKHAFQQEIDPFAPRVPFSDHLPTEAERAAEEAAAE